MAIKTTQELKNVSEQAEKINRRKREQELFAEQQAEANTLLQTPAEALGVSDEEQIGTATPLIEGAEDLTYTNQIRAAEMADGDAPLSEAEQLSQDIMESGTDDPLIQKLQRTQLFDDAGRPYVLREDEARALVDEASEISKLQAPVSLDFGYDSPESFSKEMQAQNIPITASGSSILNLTTMGKRFALAFQDRGTALFNATDPDSLNLQKTFEKAGLLENKQGTIKLGNVFALQLVENILDELNVKDKLTREGQAPEDSRYIDDDSDIFYDEVEMNQPFSTPKEKDFILNPMFERHKFGKGILNRALTNQGQVGAATVLFGGEGDRADSKTLELIDGLSYQVLANLGYIKPVTDNEQTFYEFTRDGISFFDSVREIVDDVFPERSILPSLFPNETGVGFGLEKTRGQKAAGNKSVKSLASETNREEEKAMHHAGRVAMRVNNDSLITYANIIHSNIKYTIKNRRVILSRQAFVDQHESKYCSLHPTAKTLGISEADWDTYNRRALARGLTDEEAREQANLIVGMQARLRVKNLMVGDQFRDRSIYMKRFFATANNRFHFRNSAFDPQNSKAVRNLLTGAESIYLDATKDSPLLENWKYIIGRALLLPEDFQTVNANVTRAEDMGWNPTLNLAKDILFTRVKDGGRFETVRKQANAIRKISGILDAGKFRESFENLDPSLKAVFTNKDDWGLTQQAYIDFANYADAIDNNRDNLDFVAVNPVNAQGRKTSIRTQQLEAMLNDARESGDQDQIQMLESDLLKENEQSYLDPGLSPFKKQNPKVFQARATAKHDGKQSGMSIYSLLFGIEDMVKRVGLLYADETDIIPEGDIRDYFMSKIYTPIESLNVEPKVNAYKTLFESLKDSKEFAKALSRSPLMETSYGSYVGFQHQTVVEILGSADFGTNFSDAIATIANDIPNYNEREAIKDLNEVIGKTLQSVLSLDQQVFLKDVGRMWGMIGETPKFITPTGKFSYFGSREMYDTGKTVTLPLPEGEKEVRPLLRSAPSGNKRTSSIPLVYDIELGTMVRGEKSKFNQETINQLPVLFIQSIDGAVMAKTINYVNRNRSTPLFFVDIHDALITDARSVSEYHGAYNRIYKELIGPTEKGYKAIDAVMVPLNEQLKETLSRLDNNNMHNVSFESRRWRGLHQEITNFVEYISKEDKNISKELSELFTSMGKAGTFTKAKPKIGNELKNWDADGAMLTGKEISAIIKMIYKFYQINPRARDIIQKQKLNRETGGPGWDSLRSQLEGVRPYPMN